VRGVAKYLAQEPGRWITSEPIATALKLEQGWNSLGGALGAAGHYFKNREIAMPCTLSRARSRRAPWGSGKRRSRPVALWTPANTYYVNF
jgi:hypothetical protein